MDVRLSPEQRALRDSAAQVVGHLGPRAVGQLDDAERVAKLDAAVTAAGWRELRAAADGTEPWASGVEVALVAEQLGRGLADTAFLGPTLAADLRRRAGAPPATRAETVLLRADLSALATAPDRGATALDAAGAGTALVLVAVDGRWSLATVDLDEPETAADLTRRVAVPAAGAVPRTVLDQTTLLDDDAVARTTALGVATACADLVGTMQGAVDLACGYVAERRQFGQPVGTFQAVQHLLADAFVATEGSRSTATHAAWAVDALPTDEATFAVAVAKAYAARSARTVCESVIQVHGGIGNTWECLAHVFLRRALLTTEVFGGVDASLGRILHHHRIGAGDGLR